MATSRRSRGVVSEPRQVTVLVNGQVVGGVPETGTVGEASAQIARTHGLRSYSLKMNGKKLAMPDLNKSLKGAKTLEVYAKDARG